MRKKSDGMKKPLSISINEETQEYIKNLVLMFKKKKSHLITEFLNKFLKEEAIQDEFKKYSTTYAEVPDFRQRKTSVNDTISISDDLLAKLDSAHYDYGFFDRSSFLKCFISYLHDKYHKNIKELEKYRDKISILLSSKGYVVKNSGIIGSDIYFLIRVPEV